VATARREIGLRSLGAHGKQLLREGKPWTLRGVFETSTAAALPRAWHDAAAAYVSDQADEERLLEASQWGAIAAVGIGGRSEEIADHLRQLALHPAAALAIVNGDLPRDFKPPSVAPNILLAQRHKATDPLAVRPWANLLWAEVSEAEALSKLMPMAALPVVAVRRLASPLPIDQARAACDQLQRDLAPIGQFAGYIV
jgi:hypothetical protein